MSAPLTSRLFTVHPAEARAAGRTVKTKLSDQFVPGLVDRQDLQLEEGAFRKRRSLGAGFLCSQLLDDNRRFPTHSRQGERPWRSTNPGGGPNQRKSLSNRAIGARRSGPRFETSNSRSKPGAATHP